MDNTAYFPFAILSNAVSICSFISIISWNTRASTYSPFYMFIWSDDPSAIIVVNYWLLSIKYFHFLSLSVFRNYFLIDITRYTHNIAKFFTLSKINVLFSSQSSLSRNLQLDVLSRFLILNILSVELSPTVVIIK